MPPLLLASIALAQPGPCRGAHRGAARPPAIGSVVSETYPIRVHWDRPGDEARAQLVLEHAELAWAVQVDELGFRAPHLPDGADGPELDIYLAPVGAGEAWAQYETWRDQVPGDGYNTLAAFIVMDRDLPERSVPAFTVHEFNHVLQWATDFSEWTLPIWEGVATAAQTWTLGDEGRWAADVGSFQEIPWHPALLGDSSIWYEEGVGAFYEYGSALWVMHLDQVLGNGDGLAGAALWEAAANEGERYEPDVVDAFAEGSGVELGEAFNLLARTRFLVGPDWDPRGLPDARTWGQEHLVPASPLLARELPVAHRFEPAPRVTGQAFLDLTGLSEDTVDSEQVVVRVVSERGDESAVLALWWATDGSVGEVQAWGADPALEIDRVQPGGAVVERVVVALTHLGPPGFDPDVHDFHVPGDQVVYVALDDPDDDVGEGPSAPVPRGLCSAAGGSPTGLLALLGFVVARRSTRRRFAAPHVGG